MDETAPWRAWGLAVVPIHPCGLTIERRVEINSAVREGGRPDYVVEGRQIASDRVA